MYECVRWPGDCHQGNITLERVFPLIQHGGAQSRPTKEYFLPFPLFLATTVLDAYKPLLERRAHALQIYLSFQSNFQLKTVKFYDS